MSKISAAKLATVPETLHRSIQATSAEFRQLGRSGLRALPLLKYAYDKGINTWDTANIYSNGQSEVLMGKAMRKYNIPRRKLTLMTKCYRVVCDQDNYEAGSGVAMHGDLADQSKDYANQWGLSRGAIFSAVEASLERLGTTYIDVLQIHRYDNTVSPEETMGALHDLVRSGKVRYLGASSMWTYQFATLQHVAEKHGFTKFVAMQNHYNLMYREEEREMNRYCRMTGVGLMPWAPLAGGQLARAPEQNGRTLRSIVNKNGAFYHNDGSDSEEIVRRVCEVARRRGWPMSHVALAWLNRRVTAPIIGFSSAERIDEALAARGKVLTEEEERHLEEAYRPQDILGHA
ncbi:hypothetical protein CFE70_002928 [Pyrenophora teres f. teres 0-1]